MILNVINYILSVFNIISRKTEYLVVCFSEDGLRKLPEQV